jgi:hypothetical protein
MGTHWMIFLTIGNLVSPPSSLFTAVVPGRTWPAPCERKDLPVLGCYGNGGLVECRVGNLIGFNLGSSLNHHCRQDLRYFCIGFAVVSFRVLCCVPEADSERFCSPGATNVISSWNPFCFRSRGRMSFSILWVDSATLLGFRCMETLRVNMTLSLVLNAKGGESDNHYWFRYPEDSFSPLTILS